VKIGGSSIPWTKRQKAKDGTLPTMVMIKVGTTAPNMAAVIRRLRPTISASTPVNGAVSAMAPVPAVISQEISLALTPNSRESSGSSACGV
jgi:hypothetical protein